MAPELPLADALLEVCLEDEETAREAERGGAGRLELCAHLAVGGLAPSRARMRAVRAAVSLPVFAMVRVHARHFRCGAAELTTMREQIAAARAEGMDGVVLGALDAAGRVDAPAVARLLELAAPLPVTFHRAFDRVPDLDEALEALAGLGVARILSSGGAETALAGADALRRLVAAAWERPVVVPGGGVRAGHAAELLRRTGAREVHSAVVSGARPRAEDVRALVRALRGGGQESV